MKHDEALALHRSLIHYHEMCKRAATTPSARAHHVDMVRKLTNAAEIIEDAIREACT